MIIETKSDLQSIRQSVKAELTPNFQIPIFRPQEKYNCHFKSRIFCGIKCSSSESVISVNNAQRNRRTFNLNLPTDGVRASLFLELDLLSLLSPY